MRKHDQRNQTILELYDAGLTLGSIGERFGLTSERVRQICAEHRPARGHKRRVRRDPALAAKLLRRALTGETAGVLRHQPTYVKDWFRELTPSPFLGARTTDPNRELYFEPLRRAAADEGTLTPAVYSAWADANGEMSIGNFQRLFGDFRTACDEAGVKCDYERREYARRWSDDEYRAILTECAEAAFAAGKKPTYGFYASWRSRDHPSPALLRCVRGGVQSLPLMQERVQELLQEHYEGLLGCLEGGEWVEG